MSHNYYEDDYDDENESRLIYFDRQFDKLVKKLAREQGLTTSSYLSQITSLESFKAVLQQVFSLDGSLASYVGGMSDRAFKLFYNRDKIQSIVEANRGGEIEQYVEQVQEQAPEDVEQVEGEVVEYFQAEFKDKESGRTVRTVGKKTTYVKNGKTYEALKDSRGRFVKKR